MRSLSCWGVGISVVGMLTVASAGASDFYERLAAWQAPARGLPSGPPSVLSGQTAPRAAPPAPSTPPPSPSLGMRYAVPQHRPDYQQPWGAPCASCGHGPGVAGPADSWGTCQYADGGSCFGTSCGGCRGCPPGGLLGAGPWYAAGCGPDGCGWSPGNPWGTTSLVWMKFDVLLGWRQGRDFPPLVTSDPSTESSTTAGVLPDAQTLFGGGRVGSHMQAGGRFDVGVWASTEQCFGIGWRLFGLGKDASEFNITSADNPVLAIPFRDFNTGTNDALLVAYPGLRTGEIHVAASSSVLGHDVYTRWLLCRDCDGRLDFLTGWHYARIADGIEIRSRSTVTEVGGTIPVGTVTDIRDQFTAHNDFHGAIFGLLWEGQRGCWTTQFLTRISIGNMRETMLIDGSTRVRSPQGTTTTTDGGLFTAASNLGRFTRNEFTAVTEAGLNLGYRFRPCTQLNIGYTFVYFNDILSPGKAIDPQIGTLNGVTHPRFVFRHSDFWMQAINLGLTREF